jgi:hypothetical protein
MGHVTLRNLPDEDHLWPFVRVANLHDENGVAKNSVAKNEGAGAKPANQFPRGGIDRACTAAVGKLLQRLGQTKNDTRCARSKRWINGTPETVDAVEINSGLWQPENLHGAALARATSKQIDNLGMIYGVARLVVGRSAPSNFSAIRLILNGLFQKLPRKLRGLDAPGLRSGLELLGAHVVHLDLETVGHEQILT